MGIFKVRQNTAILVQQPGSSLMSRMFANGPGDQNSVPGHVILKTQKMVLDASLFITQHYELRIKGKVEQSRKRSCTLPYTYRKGSLQVTLDYSCQLYLLICAYSKFRQCDNILVNEEDYCRKDQDIKGKEDDE